MSKMGMSLCVVGMSEEFREYGIAVNALWPRTPIITAALIPFLSKIAEKDIIKDRPIRTPDIMADASYAMLTKPSEYTGNFGMDDTILEEEGIVDFGQYTAFLDPPLEENFRHLLAKY